MPSIIKDAKEYRSLTKNINYSGEYANELSKQYKDAMKPKKNNAIKGIALFSGCGGMTLGFEAAGVKLVGHVEIGEILGKRLVMQSLRFWRELLQKR